MKQPDLYYRGSEVPEREKSEEGREKKGPLKERDSIKWESPESGLFIDWLVEVQTISNKIL